MSVTPHVSVRHDPGRRRYELHDGERVVGEARYVPFDDAGTAQRIFVHTVVDEELSGQGLGSRLAAFALDDTVAAGLEIVAVCPYISAYLDRHEEYAASTVKVRAEHLRAVDAA